jgi:hypothetical protein
LELKGFAVLAEHGNHQTVKFECISIELKGNTYHFFHSSHPGGILIWLPTYAAINILDVRVQGYLNKVRKIINNDRGQPRDAPRQMKYVAEVLSTL